MKKTLAVLALLAGPVLAQEVYPPEGTSIGADLSALGEYNLCIETSQTATTTGTIEEVLATCTIPANSFTTGGFAGFRVSVTWDAAANVNAKTVRIRVDGLTGTVIAVHTADTTSGNQLQNGAVMLVDASGSLAGQGYFTRSTGTTGVYSALASGLTLSSDIDIVFTGETGTQAGDVTLTSYRVALISAASSTGSPGLPWPLKGPDGTYPDLTYGFASQDKTGMFILGGLALYNYYNGTGEGLSKLELKEGEVVLQSSKTGQTSSVVWLDNSAGAAFDPVHIGVNSVPLGNSGVFLDIDVDGVEINTTGASSVGQLRMPNGTIDAPSYSWADAPSAGLMLLDPPGHVVIKGYDGSGTDATGAGTYIRPGLGTGTAASGFLALSTAVPGATSGSTLNSIQDVLVIHGNTGTVSLGGVDVNGAAGDSAFTGVDVAATQTDTGGGDVYISGGRGTGAGDPGDVILRTSTTLGTGTTQQAFAERLRVGEEAITTTVPILSPDEASGITTLTESVATNFATMAIPQGEYVGGEIRTTAFCEDATDTSTITESWTFSCHNRAGAEICGITQDTIHSATSVDAPISWGTRTMAYTAGVDAVTFTMDTSCTITQTTLDMAWEIDQVNILSKAVTAIP